MQVNAIHSKNYVPNKLWHYVEEKKCQGEGGERGGTTLLRFSVDINHLFNFTQRKLK